MLWLLLFKNLYTFEHFALLEHIFGMFSLAFCQFCCILHSLTLVSFNLVSFSMLLLCYGFHVLPFQYILLRPFTQLCIAQKLFSCWHSFSDSWSSNIFYTLQQSSCHKFSLMHSHLHFRRKCNFSSVTFEIVFSRAVWIPSSANSSHIFCPILTVQMSKCSARSGDVCYVFFCS